MQTPFIMQSKRILLSLFVVILLITKGFNAAAQSEIAPADARSAEHRIHCIYIYNFTKYIQWPSDYTSGDFTIGIVGETGLADELKKMADVKTVNGRKIIVKRYKTVGEVDKTCPILILPVQSSDFLSNALKACNKNTLIVTQKAGLAKTGSPINFVSLEGKPKFEMNTTVLDKTDLKVLTQLKSIAIVVN